MPATFPEPTRIIAVRHGETAWNVATRIQGQLDIGLNDKGVWQAQRLAMALAGESFAAIYTSDLYRAWDTARVVGDAVGMALELEPGLRERGFGVFEGKTFDEIAQRWPEQSVLWRKRVPDFAPEGGESLLDFRARILECVNRLSVKHGGEQILLAAHGGVMDVLYRAATHQEIQAPRTWDLGNAAINRLLWTPDGLSIVGWSDTHHLDDGETLDETST